MSDEPRVRTFSYEGLVRAVDKDINKGVTVYQFSNDREFLDKPFGDDLFPWDFLYDEFTE